MTTPGLDKPGGAGDTVTRRAGHVPCPGTLRTRFFWVLPEQDDPGVRPRQGASVPDTRTRTRGRPAIASLFPAATMCYAIPQGTDAVYLHHPHLIPFPRPRCGPRRRRRERRRPQRVRAPLGRGHRPSRARLPGPKLRRARGPARTVSRSGPLRRPRLAVPVAGIAPARPSPRRTRSTSTSRRRTRPSHRPAASRATGATASTTRSRSAPRSRRPGAASSSSSTAVSAARTASPSRTGPPSGGRGR